MSINAHAPSSNDASIVLKLTYGTIDILFAADISSDVENIMINNPSLNLDVEILKVSHHGSKYDASDQFLSAATPEIGVISVGAGNVYGHPSSATLQRLQIHAVTVYRTDFNGTVTLTTDGEMCAVSTSK